MMEDVIGKYKDKLPASYLEFISNNQEFEKYLGDEFGYVNLWNLDALREAWEGYKFREHLSDDWFPIGSNRGGEIIVMDLSSETKELFYIPFIAQSEDDANLYCDSFSELYVAIKQHLKNRQSKIRNRKS